MPPIPVRRKAPAFTLKDQHNKSHSLKDYAGRIVVLYFYPKDETAGCTNEACQFRDHFPDFTKIKGVILGVSPDGTDSHKRFADEHQLAFTLLADSPGPKGVPPVCEAYGVWGWKMLYGRRYKGVARTTYIIDQEGRVARRWDNVKVPGHVAEVLEAVKLLHSGEPLYDIDSKPVRLPRLKHRKKTRTRDTDPQYTPKRGGGNKSSAGPSRRPVRLPTPRARARTTANGRAR
jgi:peroxiredoxin Q/BCP